LGVYKPHFEGIPEDYYPLNCKEIIYYSIVVFLTIVFGLGVLIGFIYWVLDTGLNLYS
jgi:hypothetical protein